MRAVTHLHILPYFCAHGKHTLVFRCNDQHGSQQVTFVPGKPANLSPIAGDTIVGYHGKESVELFEEETDKLLKLNCSQQAPPDRNILVQLVLTSGVRSGRGRPRVPLRGT